MEDVYMENIIKTEVILEFMEKNNLYDKIMHNNLHFRIKTILKIAIAMKVRLNQLVSQ